MKVVFKILIGKPASNVVVEGWEGQNSTSVHEMTTALTCTARETGSGHKNRIINISFFTEPSTPVSIPQCDYALWGE